MKSRYGVEYAQQSEVIKEKSRKSSLEHYGVNNPMKDPDVAFKNSLKSLTINKTVNHDYNVKLWRTKLEGKESDKCDIVYNNVEIDVLDGINHEESYIKHVFPNYIYPWCSQDTVTTWLDKVSSDTTNTSLYLLYPEKGRDYLKDHSFDIASLNNDHMYLGRVNNNDIYNVISITQTKEHVFYIDQMSPNLDLMPKLKEYVDFAEIYGIDLKYIQTTVCPDPDYLTTTYLEQEDQPDIKFNFDCDTKYVWYKGRDRFFDDERPYARNKLIKEGWNVLKAFVYRIDLTKEILNKEDK